MRDLDRMHEPLPPEFTHCLSYPEAVVSIELRAALYQLAYLNLCVNNGPGGMLLLNPRTRYISFKMTTEDVTCASISHHRRWNWLDRGDQLQYATPFQRLVWEEDRAEVLTAEFTSMVSLIESDQYSGPAAVSEYIQRSLARWVERFPIGWPGGLPPT